MGSFLRSTSEEVVVFHSFVVTSRAALVVAALCLALPASAQPPDPATGQDPQAALRAQIDQLRQQLEALQQKVAALEAAGAAPPTVQPPAGAPPTAPAAGAPPAGAPPAGVEVPAGAAGAGGPTGALPVYGNTSALSKIFNPDMAVIGNFIGAAGKNDVAPIPALRLNEAEMSFQAIVDPYARADFFLSASPDGFEIEEGFLTFPTLPGGLLMKVGKMKAQFGKVNTMHSHTLPWVDEPLPMVNLLGGDEGLNDSGISVSKLILNPVMFLEATGEVYDGNNNLFTSSKRGDLAYVGRLRGYRDISESLNLDLGTSFAHGHNGTGADDTTQLYGIDATLRYRPLQEALYKKAMLRTELFWSRREQPVADAHAFGAYVSGEYQLTRRLFGGARYDFSDRAFDPTLNDKSASLLLTYWPSEFSQIRGQLRRTRYAEGSTANELLFQFLFSIGAHGAHVF
jgi:hypothetical protein